MKKKKVARGESESEWTRQRRKKKEKKRKEKKRKEKERKEKKGGEEKKRRKCEEITNVSFDETIIHRDETNRYKYPLGFGIRCLLVVNDRINRRKYLVTRKLIVIETRNERAALLLDGAAWRGVARRGAAHKGGLGRRGRLAHISGAHASLRSALSSSSFTSGH